MPLNNADGSFSITVKGDKEVERALDKLTPDARKAIDKEKKQLAKNLAAKLRRAVISKTKRSGQTAPEDSRRRGSLSREARSGRPMGARVRPTIRQVGDTVVAGPHPMLFGTEFGMNSKSGWYAEPQFRHNTALQYFHHQGSGYWWQPTIRRAKPDADAAVKRALDDTLSHWSA